MDLIVKVKSYRNLDNYIKMGANAFLFGIKDFSINSLTKLKIKDLKKIKTKYKNIKIRKERNKMKEKKHGNWEKIVSGIKKHALSREPGIDGILVTVGLCIIALLLCVVMKDSLTTFIQTIVTAMQTKAADILTGV